ncbi:hypothetical protein I5H01_gp046 [Mycobacterium phage MarkPhew]|uniref:Lipoprotein n=1 Tax=Mycobacterium phage MarkPhew TaxID=2725625 RepID=A0A6M3T8L5_9CAUD|nr:hypothetical protein I5H01_gp046 [Mycobacterium phage MarkPhew]QJD50361.1 hypothetical protein SEA_MARKPHEW_61 [Mycobacterium phage MarkPhew]
MSARRLAAAVAVGALVVVSVSACEGDDCGRRNNGMVLQAFSAPLAPAPRPPAPRPAPPRPVTPSRPSTGSPVHMPSPVIWPVFLGGGGCR